MSDPPSRASTDEAASSTRRNEGDSNNDDDEQPMLFYQGSPMHDYLASVAPEEVQSTRRMDSIVQRPGSGHTPDSPEAVDGVGRPSISPRRQSRSSSKTSSGSSAHLPSRRKRSSPSKHSSIPRTSSASPSKRQLSTPPPQRTTEQPEDPLLHEARERLNLLLVSYLSAPHYSALPLQDQECIDRETVNAFLLDERFQRYGNRRATIVGGRNNHGDKLSISSRNTGSHLGTFRNGEQQHSNEIRPTPVVISKSQLIILGLCSLALLTPTSTSSTSTTSSSSSQSILNEIIASILPESINSWPAWTGALIRTAPGVVALTSLATFFARSSLRSSPSSLVSPATEENARQMQDENERDAIVKDLRKLFATCKKFIDECTRLDITLEKGFKIISELDKLAELESEPYDDTEGNDIDCEGEIERDDDDIGHWQDLTTIEARLSTHHPAQYVPSNQETRRRKRRIKRLPALEVRSAIFSSLYTIQEKIEKDLDMLSNSLAGSPSPIANDIQAKDPEETLDSLELVRLFDMYNCHPPTYQNQYTPASYDLSSVQEDEQAAEELYRRTMARRSLSPTLYTEQQQQAQSNNGAPKLKHRRSAMYIPVPATQREQHSTDTHPSALNHEEQLSRRASWAAFHPSQRRNFQPVLHQQTQKAAPASPSSMMGSRPRNTAAIATPPRVRPQSIHFGGVLPASSNMMVNVTSSPLANGAIESNSTIKRERRRRSDQFFSASAVQSNLHLPDEEALLQLRSSISSTASRSSSVGSSAAMRMSTSSQGTSADPITAASCIPELYDSPSRPSHARRTSLGPMVTSSSTLLKQQNRRSRPLSMHELDYSRSLQRNSFSHLTERPLLDEVPEADSTALHRNAAAAALERKWSSYAQNPLSNSMSASSSFTSSLHGRARSRPTSLLLQSSPILSSPHVRRENVETDSPAASFRSRKYQHRSQRSPQQEQHQTRSKFDLLSLRERSQDVSTLERALVCHLLALKYSSLSPSKLKAVLQVLVELVEGINSTVNTETSSLSQTMWEEFEESPNKPEGTEIGSTAPSASILLATPMTSSPFHSTPQRQSYIACLPGSYPSSPMIEVDPATPPPDIGQQVSQGSFFPTFEQNENQPNFAPREPFSAAEQNGSNALAETHLQLNAALRTVATKLYMERQDLKEYFNNPLNSVGGVSTLEQMEARHESLRTDLQTLMKSWEEGRATFRQMKEGRQRRLEGPRASRDTDRQVSSDTSEYDNAEEEPSLLSISAELEKYGSISSVLSSGNEDSLSTPALSPVSQATYQPMNIAELLLDSNGPQYLPRYGMQEQLYESYVDNEDNNKTNGKCKGKFSREERIALAKAKRLEKEEQSAAVSDPQANAELISELKDMVALLRSRNAAVLPPQQT